MLNLDTFSWQESPYKLYIYIHIIIYIQIYRNFIRNINVENYIRMRQYKSRTPYIDLDIYFVSCEHMFCVWIHIYIYIYIDIIFTKQIAPSFLSSVLLLMIKWRHKIVKVLWIHEPQASGSTTNFDNVDPQQTLTMLWCHFIINNEILSSITFLAWWWLLKTSNRVSLGKNLTGRVTPLPGIN